jgi:hypothetical protein
MKGWLHHGCDQTDGRTWVGALLAVMSYVLLVPSPSQFHRYRNIARPGRVTE